MRNVPCAVIVIGLVLCLSQFCWAQNSQQADKIIEDCQKSVKAADQTCEKSQQKTEDERNEELLKAESLRDKEVDAAREDAIKKLVTIIDKQAEASDFEGVLNTWKRMAEVDPNHQMSSGMIGKKARGILKLAKVFKGNADAEGTPQETTVKGLLQEYRRLVGKAEERHKRVVETSEGGLNQVRSEARAKAVKALTTIARKRAQAGDTQGSIEAWTAVREVDPKHVQAQRILRAAGVPDDDTVAVPGNRRSGKKISGTIHVIGNHSYSLCVNGKLVITGDSSSVKSVPFSFAIGDLITVSLSFKVGRSGDYHGFKMFFQSNDKKVRLFTNTREWYEYSPSDLKKWYEVKPNSQHPQAVLAFEHRVKMPIADGTGAASIWGESSKSGSTEPYLYHVVSEADLAE